MYNWCHGPECHERVTQDRVRGNKGNKVLRTRKIRETNWNKNTVWSNFCSQGCWNDFMNKHWNEFIRLHPRTEALETPIEDPKKVERQYGWSSQKYYTTEINKKTVDNNNSNDRIIP